MPLALLALAIGAFGIGTTEFVIMGVLPQVADDFGVSVPTASQPAVTPNLRASPTTSASRACGSGTFPCTIPSSSATPAPSSRPSRIWVISQLSPSGPCSGPAP